MFLSLFGWLKKKNNLRRFRRTFITVARKNGKSTLMAGIALIMFLLDDESSARVYCAAVSKDQTKEVAEAVGQFVRNNPELRNRVSKYHNRLYDSKTNSEFRALASESDAVSVWHLYIPSPLAVQTTQSQSQLHCSSSDIRASIRLLTSAGADASSGSVLSRIG